MTQRCVMSLTLGHISKVKVTEHTFPKPCQGHNFSLPCWILIIYHTIIWLPSLRVISPRSKSVYIWQKFVSRPFTFTGNLYGDDTSHNCCPSPRGCCSGYLSRKGMSSYTPRKRSWGGGYIGITLSVCLSVCLSRVNLTLTITFWQKEIKLWYYIRVFLMTRPFCRYQNFWPRDLDLDFWPTFEKT